MRQKLSISPEDTNLFELAAQIEGKSIQQFVLDASIERANRVMAMDKTNDPSRITALENLLAQAHSYLGEYAGQAYHEVQSLRARIREALK